MNVTKIFPGPSEDVSLDIDGASNLAALYATPNSHWLRINFVASVNGNAAGEDGTSQSLTSTIDRRILGAIRRHSDVVVVGASTVRTEGYFLPKSAPLAIVTGSGDLSGHEIPADVEEGRVIVVCPREARELLTRTLGDREVTVIDMPGPRLDPAAIITALRDRGYENIVCEGGPTLASQLMDAGLVDELCLTTSPVVNTAHVQVLSGLSRSQPLHLTQLLVDPETALYARWLVKT